MSYLELLCPCICAGICLIHFIVSLIVGYKQGKKIDRICDQCGFPIYKDEKHECVLSSEQLEKLVSFVFSIRGDSNGDKH